ncbi:hypothetical protein Trco_008329 [Trichoderma cornu-damae]|uniref:Ricin B lectin domain-containing protein n=1 Tax=Trichoderma cornu-damae TaxID=654480 RepID=A0A9P8QFH1_9HYPO|nr:hypothetical protein Trco_008329 [Trichoderma cornu-damae]
MISKVTFALLVAALAAAGPVHRRGVASLDPAATAEAHQRDNTATRAFSNVQIKTSDGKCLSVDPLSGDFRANLTPIQVTDCGSAQGQGWDVITSGVHNDQKGQALIVSTLTQACFNFDPRRPAGNQVLLFSCGGRADGGGQVTDSQLFAFAGGAGPLSLTPENSPTKCFAVKGGVVDVADCSANDAAQKFTFGDSAGGSNGGGGSGSGTSSQPAATQAPATSAAATTAEVSQPAATTAAAVTSPAVINNPGLPSGGSQTTVASSKPAITGTPTTPLPVSRAGGTLNPSAASEANAFDGTAVRPVESVNVRAADGRCLFVDPTAGDFRENLIPIQLAKCSEDPGQKFDVVTRGAHDDGAAGEALIVSVLTNGCVNFDGRRAQGDTVIMFSCGGRADGSGQTTNSQLFPFEAGSNNIVLTPASDNNKTCLVAGADRVESAQCNGQKDQVFELVEIL